MMVEERHEHRPGSEGSRAACPGCGAAWPDRDARFCGRCGAMLVPSGEPAEQDPAPDIPTKPADPVDAASADEQHSRRHLRPRSVALGLFVLVLVVAAVGGLLFGGEHDDEVAGEPAAEAEAYLAAVADIVREDIEALGWMDTVLGGTYTDRQAWLDAFDEVLRDTPHVDEMLAAARELDPPPGYLEAHEAWLGSLERLQTLREGLASGVERGDVLIVTIAAQRFVLDLTQVLLLAPRPLCEVLAPMATVLFHEGEFCRDPAELPGGLYGQQVWTITRELAVEVFPRTGVRAPAFTDQEELALLTLIFPVTEQAVAEALSELERLEPPGHLRSDHEAAVEFLSGIRHHMAEVGTAAEAGDLDTARQLSPAPIVRQFERRLSDEGRDLFILLLPD